MNMKKTCVVIATLCFASSEAQAQQANVNLDWNPHKNVQNLNPYGANVISPEVRDDQTVTFRLKAPDVRTVALTGGPILLAVGKGSAPIPFEKGTDGVWTLTVGPLKPNLYIYRLLVDGVAVVDPNNKFTGFADQPGYSTVVVHADGPAYYDAKPVPNGTVTRHVYHSTVLNGEREMYVYTPPNYDRNRRYPVLYLLGGSGELSSTWNIDGRAGFIADNLIAEGKALPMIIDMPNNQVVHRGDPRHTELTFSLFEKELRQQIIPVVEKAYSTQTGPRGRAIAACASALVLGAAVAAVTSSGERIVFGFSQTIVSITRGDGLVISTQKKRFSVGRMMSASQPPLTSASGIRRRPSIQSNRRGSSS